MDNGFILLFDNPNGEIMSEIKDLVSKSKVEIARELIEKGEINLGATMSKEDVEALKAAFEKNEKEIKDVQDALAMAPPPYKWRPKDVEYYEYDNGMIRRDGLYKRIYRSDSAAITKLYRQTWIEMCTVLGANRPPYAYELSKAETPIEFRDTFVKIFKEEVPALERQMEANIMGLLYRAHDKGARSLEEIYKQIGFDLQYEDDWGYSSICLLEDLRNLSLLGHLNNLFIHRRAENIAGRFIYVYGKNFGNTIISAIKDVKENTKENGSPYIFDYFDMSERGDVIDAAIAAMCWPDKFIRCTTNDPSRINAIMKDSVVFGNSKDTDYDGWLLQADLSHSKSETTYLCAAELASEWESSGGRKNDKSGFIAWAIGRLLPEYATYVRAISAIIGASKMIKLDNATSTALPSFHRFQTFGAEATDWINSCFDLLKGVTGSEEIFNTLESLTDNASSVYTIAERLISIAYDEIQLDPVDVYNMATTWTGGMNKGGKEVDSVDFTYYRILRDIAAAFNPQE